jgi:hypothetical protein
MERIGVMRKFNTRNFSVVVEAYPEHELDLSWDEDHSVANGLRTGRLIAFLAHAEVILNGRVVGEYWLGNCIYRSFEDFMDHKECGKQNRQWAEEGKAGRCGSYFRDMIHEAIAHARSTVNASKSIYIRRESR